MGTIVFNVYWIVAVLVWIVVGIVAYFMDSDKCRSDKCPEGRQMATIFIGLWSCIVGLLWPCFIIAAAGCVVDVIDYLFRKRPGNG